MGNQSVEPIVVDLGKRQIFYDQLMDGDDSIFGCDRKKGKYKDVGRSIPNVSVSVAMVLEDLFKNLQLGSACCHGAS